MPFVSAALLRDSLDHLRRYPPLLLISVPAMLKNDLPTARDQSEANTVARQFGAREENEVLDAYFRPPGGPPRRPYFNTRDWVRWDYAGSSLQRQRVDHSRDLFFKTGTRFCLREGFADVTAADPNLLPGGERISLIALGAWLYRAEDVDSLDVLAARAISEFKLDRDELLEKVFDSTATEEQERHGLADEPISDEELAQLIGAAPPPPRVEGGLTSLVSDLESKLTARGVILAAGVVDRIVRAWAARDIVVLVGAPGTGKTTLALEFARALTSALPPGEDAVIVPIEPDYDTTRILGYENLAGDYVPRPLTATILETPNPLHPHVVLLEEWNTSQVEMYLAPILHAIESGSAIPLERGRTVTLPVDTLFLATCNSYRDEPETRLPVSRPTKRRTTIIEMPNVLLEAFERDGEEGIHASSRQLVERERAEIADRRTAGRGTWLDDTRAESLEGINALEDLPAAASTALLRVVTYLLGETNEGKRFLTAGLLKDILLQLCYAADEAPAALGYQMTDKLLHQVTSMEVAEGIAERCDQLPTHAAIVRFVDEMRGPGGSVAPLL